MVGELALGLILTAPAWGFGEVVGRGVVAYRRRPARADLARVLATAAAVEEYHRAVKDFHYKVIKAGTRAALGGAYASSIEHGTESW